LKKLALSQFLYLGASLRFLQDAEVGMPIHSWGRVLYNLDHFAAEIQRLNLRVTSSVFNLKQLHVLTTELKTSNEDAKLTEEQAKKVRVSMEVVRATLLAEADNLPAYMLSEKRFEVARLVTSPATFLHEHTFTKLPPIAQSDIQEAGRCIAFDTPTAAGFLLLRATERALRAYYSRYFKVKKDEKLMWGPMITRLRNKSKKSRPNKILLDHLDNIRFNFRNPTDHPEKTYGIDEVQDLFSLVADVLNRVAAEFP
jgi:hypothetical protein